MAEPSRFLKNRAEEQRRIEAERQAAEAAAQAATQPVQQTSSPSTVAVSKPEVTAPKPVRNAAAYEQAKNEARQKKAMDGYSKQQLAAAMDQTVYDFGVKQIDSLSEEDKQNLGRYVAERSQYQVNMMMGDQRMPTYNQNPLVEKYGEDAVRRMAETYERQQNEQNTQMIQEASTGKTGLGANLLSIGANVVGGLTATAGRAMEMANRTGQYQTLQENTAGDALNIFSNTVRQETAEKIAGDKYDEEGNKVSDGGTLRQALSVGYQGAMSAADSIARAIAGGGGIGTLALAGTGSFSQTVSEASKQGATPAQAIVLGVGNAAIEAATEKVPLDNMLKSAKGGIKGAKAIAKEALRQAAIEAGEEEISLFGNLLLEAAVLQEKSGYKQSIAEAIANGMSYEEAKKQANLNVWNEALNTAAVSAAAGLFSGGGSATFGSIFGTETQTPMQTEQTAEVETPAQTELPAQAVQEDVQKTKEQMIAEDLANRIAGKNTDEQKNTAIVNGSENGLRQYTQKEKENWKSSKRIVLFEGVEQFRQFIRNALTGKDNGGKKMYFGAISDGLAAKIGEATNLSVAGYNLSLGENEIRKINKSHGNEAKEAQRGQRAVTEDDYLNIPNIIQNADEITRSASDYNGKPAIEFKKRNGNEVTTVVAVVSDKRLDVFVQTEYINKKSGSIATPESVQADSFTPKATGGTAPVTEVARSTDVKYLSVTPEAESVGTSNNIISEANQEVKGTGAAEANFSGKAQYQDLLYEGNVQPDRASDVRPMEVPKTDSYGRNVSEFVGNAYGAEVTPDKMANVIEELVQEGALGFDRRSNQSALNDAAKVIENSTPAAITKRITGNIANGKIKDGDIEQAMLLYSHYANKNGERAQAQAAELMVDLTTMAHMTGRNLQLFKLLRKLTPEGQVMTIKRTVEQNVESMIRSGKAKDGSRPQINEQLLEDYKNAAAENARAVSAEQKAESEAKMQEIQQAIMADAASQIQSTFKAKWDAWRYMAMLGNGKTQIRNFAGNVFFMPYKAAKDTIGAAFELAMPKEKRTKAMPDIQLLKWAKQDSKTAAVQDALKYTGKLGDDATNAKFADNVKVFDTAALEAVRKFTADLPAKADLVFKNEYYASSIAGFLKARGYSLQDVQGGKVSDAVMAEARGYAINEAMKATFNDCNSFSDMVSNLRFKDPDTTWKKVANMAGESALPFRRTPANILVRFAEYSPAGLAKGAWDMATKVSSGKISAAAAVDQIASGLTGTGALVLGYFMAKGIAGVKLTGSGADDDEKRQGHQDYALEFSINGREYSYTIDWAAPANLPLFVGANLYNAMERNGADTSISALSRIWQVSKGALEPMMKLSCMSSLNDLFETARYAPEGEALYSVAADIATGYFTQGIPALLRQTAQAMQANKQTTFANDPDPTVRELQKLGAQIPFVGAQFQTEKRNAWGETETIENPVLRAVNAFLNPGTLKAIDNSELEREIIRLGQTQEENVTPPDIPKKLNYTDANGEYHKDYRLTEEQYQKIAEAQGQTAADILNNLVRSSDYRNLTDQQKAYAINAVYEYAQEMGKKAALPDYHSTADAWISKTGKYDLKAYITQGAKKALNSAIQNAVNSLQNGWTVTAAAKKDMEETYAGYSKMSEETKQRIVDELSGDVAKYLAARESGISTDKYLSVKKQLIEIKPEDGYNGARAVQKAEAVAAYGNLTEDQKTAMVKLEVSDTQDQNIDDVKKLGYDITDYVKMYRDYEDYTKGTGKKDRTIQKWMKDYGISYNTAKALYEVFQK